MTWQDRIIIDPDILAGKPIVRGTRISVEFVIDLLGRGWTHQQILSEYDHLTPEDIQACLAYAGAGTGGASAGVVQPSLRKPPVEGFLSQICIIDTKRTNDDFRVTHTSDHPRVAARYIP